MIRARYLSTAPFSFRREQATTKMAQTYPCPTPYAAKVALIVGAIRAGLDPESFTRKVRDVDVRPHPWGEGVVNTHLTRHWEPPRSSADLPPGHLKPTVVYREFVYFDGGVDLHFPAESLDDLRPALPGVNCFGKQGSFFALKEVAEAEPPKSKIEFTGSDMKPDAEWEDVSNFSGSTRKPRESEVTMGLDMHMAGAGEGFMHLKFNDTEEQ